jgi:hypothetical protein
MGDFNKSQCGNLKEAVENRLAGRQAPTLANRLVRAYFERAKRRRCAKKRERYTEGARSDASGSQREGRRYDLVRRRMVS